MTAKSTLKYSTIILLIGLLFIPQPAIADGNKLLKSCTAGLRVINKDKGLSSTELVDATYCAGLVQGITDTNRINRMSGSSPLFCIPGDVIDKGQATRIVVNYLRAHPEKMKMHESNLVIDALMEAFPCR